MPRPEDVPPAVLTAVPDDQPAAPLPQFQDAGPPEVTPGPLIKQAWDAHHRRDWPAALRDWADLRSTFPWHPAGFTGALNTLRQSGDLTAIESLTLEALLQFPNDAGVASEHALNAMASRNLDEAVARWQVVRERFPDHIHGYTMAATALRELRRFDEADALLHAAIDRFPDNAAPLTEYAWLAQIRQDWPAALARWEQLRQKFPGQPGGYTAAAAAARALGLMADAEALLAEAMTLFPDDPGPLIEYGRLAQATRDWEQSVVRWASLRARFPDHSAGYTNAAAALRELGRDDEATVLMREASVRFPDDPAPAIEAAWLATHRRNWSDAENLWESVRERFPSHPTGYTGGARVLRDTGRFDEADAMLQDMRMRFPHDPSSLVDLAWLSHIRRDWPEAVRRWAEVRSLLPGDATGYLQAARALCALWRYDEAEQLLISASSISAHAADAATQLAWIAYQQNRLDTAEERFAAVREKFPAMTDGWLGGALVLRARLKLDDAETMLLEAMRRSPNDPRLLYEYAQLPAVPLSAEQKNWPEALARMARLRTAFPDYEPGYVTGAQYLRDAGQPEESERIAREGTSRLPDSIGLALEYARAAEHRADWPEALQRFTVVRQRFPGVPGGGDGVAKALAALGRETEAEDMRKTRLTSNADGLTATSGAVTDLEDIAEPGHGNRMSETPVLRIMGEDVRVELTPVMDRLPELEGQPFKHAISLGLHCYTSASLKRLGFKRYSLPFDWAFTRVDTILDCLNHDFSIFLDQKYYRVSVKDDGHEDVFHDFYDPPPFVAFPHFNPATEEGHAYLTRCVERFREVLASPGPKFFMSVQILWSADDTRFQEEFSALCATLSQMTTQATIVGIQCFPAGPDRPVGIEQVWRSGQHALYHFASASKMGGTDFPDASDDRRIEALVRQIFADAREREKEFAPT